MIFSWGGGGGGGGGERVSGGSDFYTFYFAVLSEAHFVCLGACCLFRFEKLFYVFVKAENIVIHILIHTIQLIFSAQKLYLFCTHIFFFFLVLPFLQIEK